MQRRPGHNFFAQVEAGSTSWDDQHRMGDKAHAGGRGGGGDEDDGVCRESGGDVQL